MMRTTTPVLCLLTLAFTTGSISAQPAPVTMQELRKLSIAELDSLFEAAAPGPIPVGYARGQVLVMMDARLPRVQARMASTVWRGKHFEENGEFINQWIGVQGLRGAAQPGTSWHDDKPCIAIEYPPNTPLFGKTRDELREIAPGLYLARLYSLCPCPRFKGYFAIQACCR